MRLLTSLRALLLLIAPLTANAGQLILLTGDQNDLPPDQGSPRSTLFSVDKTTAATTQVMALGNGDLGEVVAFDPVNRLLYHASGNTDGNEFFETVDPVSKVVGPNLEPGNTYSTPDGSNAGVDEITGLAFYPPTGTFLATTISMNLYSVDLLGGFTLVGATSGKRYRGLCVVGSKVYAIDPISPNIVRLDPAMGSVVETIPMLVDGASHPSRGGTALTYDSDTGVVYAIVQSPDAAVNKIKRFLATVDLATGAATTVGSLPDGSASLTVILNKVVPPPAAPSLTIASKIKGKNGKATIKGTVSSNVTLVQVKAGKGGFKTAKLSGGKFKFAAKGLPESGKVKAKVRAATGDGQSITKTVKITLS